MSLDYGLTRGSAYMGVVCVTLIFYANCYYSPVPAVEAWWYAVQCADSERAHHGWRSVEHTTGQCGRAGCGSSVLLLQQPEPVRLSTQKHHATMNVTAQRKGEDNVAS